MGVVLPLWMKMILSPAILWLIISPFVGALVAWKFIFSNSADSEKVENKDKNRSVFKTWLTIFLCNFLSCVLLLIIEFIMRMCVANGNNLSSLVIWDSPLTVIVYMIPVIISFFVISSQIRRRARYLMSERTPSVVASWIMAVLYTPWFILIPSSAIWNLTEIIK